MRRWERDRLEAEAETKRRYLDEWARTINEHGGFGPWSWVAFKDQAVIAGILENVAGRGQV